MHGGEKMRQEIEKMNSRVEIDIRLPGPPDEFENESGMQCEGNDPISRNRRDLSNGNIGLIHG